MVFSEYSIGQDEELDFKHLFRYDFIAINQWLFAFSEEFDAFYFGYIFKASLD
jgi:hypothetical protein